MRPHDDHIWVYGRSGKVGQFVGDFVLRDLMKTLGFISHRSGSVFETARIIIVARVCSTDEYLPGSRVHWSTTEARQEEQLLRNRTLEKRELYYLFITGRPSDGTILYWLIPLEVVRAGMAGIKLRADGAAFATIVAEKGGRSILNGIDVTSYFHCIRLNGAEKAEFVRLAASRRRYRRSAEGRKSDSVMNAPTSVGWSDFSAPSQHASPRVISSTIIVGKGGMLVLPAHLRQRFSLDEGSRAIIYDDGQRIILNPVAPFEHRNSRGILRGSGALKAMDEERRREREL